MATSAANGTSANSGHPSSTPLKDVQVDAQIVDVVAKMTVEQSFHNNEDVPIEAVYVFPLDENAAVCNFAVRIGCRTVQGAMDECDEAEKAYKKAKDVGDGAYLLEQPMRDMFQISVANLPPRQSADVKISYLKLGRGSEEGAYPIPTWYTALSRGTMGRSFLAVESRTEAERTDASAAVTRRVPVSPRPGDYFSFEGAVEPMRDGPKTSHEDRESDDDYLIEAAQYQSRDVGSTAKLIITQGKGTAAASASSESLTEVQNATAKAVADAIAEATGGGDASAAADAAAEAVGVASATAMAEANAVVELEGQGSASATAGANARAVAKVVATAIAKAFADAVGERVKASSKAEARLTELRLARAVARASARAETQGGSAEQFASVVAKAVTEVVATALAEALAEVAAAVAQTETSAEATTDKVEESVQVDANTESKATANSDATGETDGNTQTNVVKERSIDMEFLLDQKTDPEDSTKTDDAGARTSPTQFSGFPIIPSMRMAQGGGSATGDGSSFMHRPGTPTS